MNTRPVKLAAAALAAAWWTVVAMTGAAAVPGAAPPSSGVRAVRAEEREALKGFDADNVAVVRTIVRRARSLPDGPERLALMQRAAEIKREAEVTRLRLQLDFARRGGDPVRAAEIELVLEQRLHPPRPAGETVAKPAKAAAAH